MLFTILVVVLLLMAIGSVPTWPHSRTWGYYPSGGLGLLVVVLLVIFLLSDEAEYISGSLHLIDGALNAG